MSFKKVLEAVLLILSALLAAGEVIKGAEKIFEESE